MMIIININGICRMLAVHCEDNKLIGGFSVFMCVSYTSPKTRRSYQGWRGKVDGGLEWETEVPSQ